MIQACCKPVLHSSTKQWRLHFAKNSVAVHWCWVTAHLYKEHIFIGVIAVIQACCKPVLQSSTEQWGLHFALNSVAVHWCWVTAHLYEEQIFIGVIAVIQACCKPVLHSSTKQWGLHFARTVIDCTGFGSLHTCMKSKSLCFYCCDTSLLQACLAEQH